MKAPATLDEFYRMFPTEERCWEHLRRMRWPRGFRCARCRGRKAHRLRGRGLWQCAKCRYQASVTAGTPLHGTRVPLRTWFLAMFVARHKKGISALQLQRDTGLGSYKTAWTLLHKVRSALGSNPLAPLRGDVEADETYVGRRQPRARYVRGGRMTPVGILVENRGVHAGRVRLERLPSVGTAELVGFVRRGIDENQATVRTDGFRSYGRLRELGIRHRPRVQRDPRRASKILPWVHLVASNLKTWLRGTFHGVSKKHLPRYLDEFSYRFDHRWREGDLFLFVLRRVSRAHPLPYRHLVAERRA
jgi:transposase-like protein/ribosomal protein L37AE/L43A